MWVMPSSCTGMGNIWLTTWFRLQLPETVRILLKISGGPRDPQPSCQGNRPVFNLLAIMDQVGSSQGAILSLQQWLCFPTSPGKETSQHERRWRTRNSGLPCPSIARCLERQMCFHECCSHDTVQETVQEFHVLSLSLSLSRSHTLKYVFCNCPERVHPMALKSQESGSC